MGGKFPAPGHCFCLFVEVYDRQDGPLQRFDPATGLHETLLAEVDGLRLTSSNYPVIDRAGNIWCANSTHAETWPQALDGRADGFIFVLRPDGSSSVVATGLKFPNGMALSADERFLFCAQTSGADVLRFPVLAGQLLGKEERYGPELGLLQRPGEPAPEQGALGYTDGIGFDADGALWVCLPAANKVVAITPRQEVVTVIHDPSGQTVNHPTNVTWGGEDLKDLYFYEDATPTASYLRYVYKYPQRRFPYAELVQANAARGTGDREMELEDLGAFADNRYFDVTVEYAKRGPNDVLMVITVENRGPEASTVHVLPHLWFRNTWSWGPGEPETPEIQR